MKKNVENGDLKVQSCVNPEIWGQCYFKAILEPGVGSGLSVFESSHTKCTDF